MITAVVLAGGYGKRLRSVVSEVPKPMALVNGRPFLEYLMDYWIDQGVDHFILVVSYKSEFIINHFGSSYKNAEINYITERTPMGTGGGLLLAAEKLTKPFLLLNGDTFFAVNLKKLQEFHSKAGSKWTFSLVKVCDPNRYNTVQINKSGKIIKFNCKDNALKDSNLYCLINGGVYLIDPNILSVSIFKSGMHCSLENELIADLLFRGINFFGVKQNKTFIDIGIPEDYLRAQCILGENHGL